MSDPNSTSPTSIAWSSMESACSVKTAEKSSIQSLLLVNACGFLMGYYIMPNQWCQIAWFLALFVLVLVYGGIQPIVSGLSRDLWLQCVIGMIAVLLFRSSIFESPGMGIKELWFGWLGSGLLLCVLLVFWLVGKTKKSAQMMSNATSVSALVAAAGSVALFYILDEKAVFGVRLTNWFVYGGWNSVCTGMTFGFAAVWSISRWHHAVCREEKWCFVFASIFLVLATLLTMSRGALLALLASHVALVMSRGWRSSVRPVLLLSACICSFQILAPQITKLGVRDLSEITGEPKLTEAMVADGIIASNPAKRLITRGDTHRFSIYAAGFSSMTTTSDWLIGKGLWAANDRWSCSLPWNPEHLHSVFVDTLFRGGLFSLLCFLGLLIWGIYRAWWLARKGEDVWVMLVSFGVAGLLFDGDSAFSLLSVPRFETLILWIPLVLASSRYSVLMLQQSTAILVPEKISTP